MGAALSAADACPRPLDGLVVLEFAETLPGPYCGKILADLGATVVKVERPSTGDPLRSLMPHLFELFNRGKASIALDLKNRAAPDVIGRLFKSADVVLESFRPGIAARLGIAWEEARRANPRLAYCSVSGFGQTGSGTDRPGHDATYAAVAGVIGPAARHDHPPAMSPLPIGDMAAGAVATVAVLATLMECQRTHRGRYCDVAIADVLASWAASKASDFLVTGCLPEHSEQQPPTHAIYEASDRRHVAIGAIEDHFWERLCEVLGREDWAQRSDLKSNAGRASAAEELGRGLEAAFAGAPAQAWVERLSAADVPASVVQGIVNAVESEQFRNRGVFKPSPSGDGWLVGFPVLLDGWSVGVEAPAPRLGADNVRVLLGSGFSTEQIDDWAHRGLFGGSDVATKAGYRQ